MTGGPLKPIQVIPPGLTGLLQLKQSGRLPDMLSDQVVPVVEMRDWYLTARRLTELALLGAVPQVVIAQAGGVGSTAIPNAVVPNNSIWYVEQLSCQCNGIGVAATDTVRFSVGIAQPGQAAVEVTQPVQDSTLAIRTRISISTAPRGFWALPGDLFFVQVYDLLVGAGNATFVLKFRATPCPL